MEVYEAQDLEYKSLLNDSVRKALDNYRDYKSEMSFSSHNSSRINDQEDF